MPQFSAITRARCETFGRGVLLTVSFVDGNTQDIEVPREQFTALVRTLMDVSWRLGQLSPNLLPIAAAGPASAVLVQSTDVHVQTASTGDAQLIFRAGAVDLLIGLQPDGAVQLGQALIAQRP